jgi:hypothetical protein
LLYSSILIAAISFFAQQNLVGQLRYQRFGAQLIVTSVGIYLTFLTTNLLLVGLGWSSGGLGAAFLVNHANDISSRRASRKIALWFLVSDGALWGAIALAHFNHIDPFASLESTRSTVLITGIGALFALAGIVRSGLLPAMRWLILTIEAPTPLSALLHAGIVNVFGYLLVALPIIQKVRPFVIGIGLLTIAASLSIMRHRHDEKGKLANGTSMQMAFMALEGVLGVPGIVLLHIVGHGSYKSWSFLRAGGAPLRRKNAMPIEAKDQPNKALILLLGVLYSATIACLFWWLGRNFLLNICIGSIALASVFLFALRLNSLLVLQTVATGVVGLFFYLGTLRLFAGFFPQLWSPSITLSLFLALTILSTTIIFRFIPRQSTLRFASWFNRYRIGRLVLKRNLVGKENGSQVDPEKLLDMVEVAGSPFIAGGALSEIVAQDTIAGLHHLDFRAAAQIAAEYGISMYQTSQQYLDLLERGVISRAALEQSLASSDIEIEELVSLTKQSALSLQHASTYQVPYKLASQSGWWSSQAWFDGRDDGSGGAYSLWRGSLGSRAAEAYPEAPLEALAKSLALLQLKSHEDLPFSTFALIATLKKLIAVDLSWYIFVKGLGREAEISLLALRASLALFAEDELTTPKSPITPYAEVWQSALEASFSSELKACLSSATRGELNRQNSRVALVTCIDVRSDVLRERAEQIPEVRTFGMAGFFGVDICLTTRGKAPKKLLNFAPIIIRPSISVADSRRERYAWALPSLWKSATSGTGALAIAEGFGLFNGLLNLVNTFLPALAHNVSRVFEAPRWMGATGADSSLLSLEQKIAYATKITSIVDLNGIKEFIFVGHGADASNTPFRSMYECGACGGNNGLLNARFAANLMNDPEVQNFLHMKYGGETVRFYAAEHNTTLGSLEFDPLTKSDFTKNSSSLLQELSSKLSALPRRSYPGSPTLSNGSSWSRSSSVAWWQVFPEWGLSANAACVIGPRTLTAGVNLSSRTFLHDYNWLEDKDGSILNTILSGPGVVMQMINFAYNMAVTDPRSFSSGDKTRHNVLGEAGVLLGSDGPLYRGMPWQSITTSASAELGRPKGHIPIRLQIFIAAPKTFIDEVVDRSSLAELVRGGWVGVHELAPADY